MFVFHMIVVIVVNSHTSHQCLQYAGLLLRHFFFREICIILCVCHTLFVAI